MNALEVRQINELAAALAKAQGQMSSAKKDSLNPHLKTNYADLASVWNAIRVPLSANGLSVVQLASCASGIATVETILMHSSGQQITGTISVPAGTTAQQIGSAITYARRYALSAIVGIAPDDDDDGDGGGGGESPTTKPKFQPVSGEQAKALNTLLTQTKTDLPKFLSYFKASSIDQISATDFARAKSSLEKKLTTETANA
jgi:hypothetical protein